MTAIETLDPLRLMVLDTLRRSDAPRFLLSMFLLPPGEHRIQVDLGSVDEDAEAWLLVAGTAENRRVCLSFPHRTEPTVWSHFLIQDGRLREAKTFEETLPAGFDFETEVRALAAGSLAVEDMCDACDLDRKMEVAGLEAPPPLESHPLSFDGI